MSLPLSGWVERQTDRERDGGKMEREGFRDWREGGGNKRERREQEREEAGWVGLVS